MSFKKVAQALESQGDISLREGACYMCDKYCPTRIHVREGKAVGIEMLDESVVDYCPRWRAQLDFVYHPERLKYPLKRVGARGEGKFERITWDEALGTIADKMLELKEQEGPESVAFYVAYTKEPRPYFRRLVHAYGSPNYTTETSSCFSAGWLAATLNFGKDYGYLLGNSRLIDPDSKCMLMWSSSIRHSNPRLWRDYLDAMKNGLKFIVVDPRRTQIASMANIHLQLRPGTDGALALGMMNVIINDELYDKEFVEKWTVGFEDLKHEGHTPGLRDNGEHRGAGGQQDECRAARDQLHHPSGTRPGASTRNRLEEVSDIHGLVRGDAGERHGGPDPHRRPLPHQSLGRSGIEPAVLR